MALSPSRSKKINNKDRNFKLLKTCQKKLCAFVDKAISNSMSRLLTSAVIIGTAFLPYNASAAEEKASQLPAVTVVGGGSTGAYNSTESSYYKLSGPLVNTPKTVSIVTRQLMDDQGITKVSDALRNVPGVSLAAGEARNQGDNINIRDFSARGDFFIDGREISEVIFAIRLILKPLRFYKALLRLYLVLYNSVNDINYQKTIANYF